MLEYLRSCRLLQCFRQLARTLLLRLEQAYVFDCYYHLVGKRRHQLGFAVGERFDPVASERNHANRLTLAQQWHTDHRANPADLSIPLFLIEWIVPRVVSNT